MTSGVQGSPDTKRCPMCAETVQTQAVICRFCGYNFGTGQMPGASDASAYRRADVPFNGLAITSLVLGLVGLIAWALIAAILDALFGTIDMNAAWWMAYGIMALAAPILAIIYGAQGMRVIRVSRGTRRGGGLAVSGMVLGIVTTVPLSVMLIWVYIDGF